MRFVSFFVAVCLVFGCFGSPAFSSDEITPEQVLSIAEQEKARLFSDMAFIYAVKYGQKGNPTTVQKSPGVIKQGDQGKPFPTIDVGKKDDRILEQPFRVHTIDPDDILKYRSGDDLSSILKPTKEWIVPLSIDGKAYCYISVGFLNGKWQGYGISVGDFVENLKKNVPPESMPGKGGTYVRIDSVPTDFVAVKDTEETKMILLNSQQFSSSAEKPKDDKGRYRASDIMLKIADSIRTAANVAF